MVEVWDAKRISKILVDIRSTSREAAKSGTMCLMTATRMKHSGSSPPDLLINYAIDPRQRSITATVDHFDSELLRMFFLALEGQGMPAIEDERKISPKPTWSVFVLLAGFRFRVRVVQLTDATTVSLLPERDGDRLMPKELTEIKALSLARGQQLQARLGLRGLA